MVFQVSTQSNCRSRSGLSNPPTLDKELMLLFKAICFPIDDNRERKEGREEEGGREEGRKKARENEKREKPHLKETWTF